MGLDFTKIKDLFVESSGDDKGSDKKENKTPVKETKDTKKQPPSVNKPTVKITAPGQVDQKIFDSLIKVLEEKNLPGEDYMEFMDAYQAMKNIQLHVEKKEGKIVRAGVLPVRFVPMTRGAPRG